MSFLKRTFTFHEALDYHTFRVFQRLQRFYKSLNVVSALLSGLSLAVLTFDEYHPTNSELIRASEGLLCSSAMSSVISITMSTMLLFKFEGYESATRRDFLAAWSPLMLLDVAIMEFLIGLVLWYADKNDLWRTGLMSGQLTFLLACCFIIATWMYVTRSFKRLVEKDRKVNLDTELGVLGNGDIRRLSRCNTQTGFV